MANRIVLCLAATLLFYTGFAQKKKAMHDLQEKIQQQLTLPGAHFAVAFKDVQTGASLLINSKDRFHAASTMKTPVLMELFKQAAEGRFLMTDSLLIKNTFSSIVDGSPYSLTAADDSEPALYTHIGERWPIDSLAYYMIVQSSNLATNLLIELVGAHRVMQTLKDLGAHDMQVLRGVEDGKAYEKGMNNTTTAFDLMLIYDRMARQQLVSPAASRAMIDILLDQRLNEIIPAGLPPQVKVAHKTGSITGIHHDSGIVFLPDGRKYVLVLLSRFAPEDEAQAISRMAGASALIYNFMLGK